MKKHEGSETSIIGASGKISTVIYTMLKNSEPFDKLKMAYVTKYKEIKAIVFDDALADDESARL